MKFELYFHTKSPYYIPANIPERHLGIKEAIEILGSVDLEKVESKVPSYRICNGDRIKVPGDLAVASGLFEESSQFFVVVPNLGLNKYLLLASRKEGDRFCWTYKFDVNRFFSDWGLDGYPQVWDGVQ